MSPSNLDVAGPRIIMKSLPNVVSTILCFFLLLARADLTLYTVETASTNYAAWGTPTTIAPIGVGKDGATTYSQKVLYSSVEVVYSTPPITTTLTDVRTATETFVEAASYIFVSYADGSNGNNPQFNGYESNCTISSENKTAACVEVNKDIVNQTTTTFTTAWTSSYTGRLVPVATLTGSFVPPKSGASSLRCGEWSAATSFIFLLVAAVGMGLVI